MNKYQDLQTAAQEERRRQKMCTGKKAYKTQRAASQKNQRTYKCPYCGHWHRSGQQTAFISQVKKKGKGIFIPRLKPGESYRPGKR